MLLVAPVFAASIYQQPLSFGLHPILELRHFVACLFFLIAGLTWARFRWRLFDSIFGRFASIAPISYALYVFHMPLAVTSTYLESVHSHWLELIGYVIVTFGLSYLAEIPFQSWINRTVGPAK